MNFWPLILQLKNLDSIKNSALFLIYILKIYKTLKKELSSSLLDTVHAKKNLMKFLYLKCWYSNSYALQIWNLDKEL